MNRSAYSNFATLIFTVAVIVAIGLVTIILRNPASHSNPESAEFYDRTQLALLGEDYDYAGYGLSELIEAGADQDLAGKTLYVRAGCIGCHGQFGQGGVVGGDLWDLVAEDPADVVRDVRDGPSGMPAFPESILADDEVELIVSFLTTGETAATAAGVTTTTTIPMTTTTTGAESTATTNPGAEATTTTVVPAGPTLVAPHGFELVIDGDPADWDGIPELALTLEPIIEREAEPREAWVRVAYDDEFIYVLFSVEDDFNWSDLDPHFAGAPGVMWAIDTVAGPHMGGEDLSGEPSLGMVDMWYWRLDCPIGVEQGGALFDPGSGKPGNDGTCNLDDEWASDPETAGDDDGPGAENSLLGVFGHTDPTEDAPGVWYFEFRRPLQTGDALDAQFEAGASTLLALAYWDPDAGGNGWNRKDHVQSSYLGWIEVNFDE